MQPLQGKQFFNHDDPFRETLKNTLPEPEKQCFGYHYTLVKNPDGHTSFGWRFFIPNESMDGRMPSKNTNAPNFPEDVYILVTTSNEMALVRATDENWQKIKDASSQLHAEWRRILGLTDENIFQHFADVADTLVQEWYYFKFDAATRKMRFWLAHPDAAGEDLRKHHGKVVPSLEPLFELAVEKVNLPHIPPHLHDQAEELLQNISVSAVWSSPNSIEITHPDAQKGIALDALCQLLDIPVENTLALGDSGNDESMLKKAGIGIAMGNAPDFIKTIADAVSQTNDRDGAAIAIERYALNK